MLAGRYIYAPIECSKCRQNHINEIGLQSDGMPADDYIRTGGGRESGQNCTNWPLCIGFYSGGTKARPGEASLAHRGVLFLDELPEFHPQVLDSLRQPLETGSITVARANAHIAYPARFQLVAAMNPCRCGGGNADGQTCRRGTRCARDYQARISGPMLDRIDLQIHVPPVTPADLALPPPEEGTAEAAARVARAREIQLERGHLNAHLPTDSLEHAAAPDRAGEALLNEAAQAHNLTARSYHRVLRVARTIADLEGQETVRRIHIAEALACRRGLVSATQAAAGTLLAAQ